MIFHPFLDPSARLMLKDTSCSWPGVTSSSSPSLQGLPDLEFTAELFLDADFSLAVLKLLALLSSLLKLLALFRAGLALWGWRRGESRGTGEWIGRGDGERDGDLGLRL